MKLDPHVQNADPEHLNFTAKTISVQRIFLPWVHRQRGEGEGLAGRPAQNAYELKKKEDNKTAGKVKKLKDHKLLFCHSTSILFLW